MGGRGEVTVCLYHHLFVNCWNSFLNPLVALCWGPDVPPLLSSPPSPPPTPTPHHQCSELPPLLSLSALNLFYSSHPSALAGSPRLLHQGGSNGMMGRWAVFRASGLSPPTTSCCNPSP